MTLPTRSGSGCAFLSWIGALALLILAPLAMAQNAPTWGGSITAPMPGIESSIVVNLRQQGVLTGHAPIAVDIFQVEVLLLNNVPDSNLLVSPYDPNPNNYGTVCIRIANAGYSPSGGQLSVLLQGTNALGTVTNWPGTPVFDAPGPTVNESDPQQVQACEDGLVGNPVNQSPFANAGTDRTVNDTDRAEGEAVVLDGSASVDPDGTIVSYEWYRLDGDYTENLGSSMTPTLQTRLPDGANTIQLVVTDNGDITASDTVLITVNAASSTVPTANAGADRVVDDTDKSAGENVVLDGSASLDPDGTIINYAWSRIDGESTENLGSGASPTLRTRLPDGENVIRLVVTDNSENSASDTVLITVGSPAAAAPTANAGADRSVADTDREQGEDVVLDGSASVDPDGTIVNYAWWHLDGENARSLGSDTSPTLQTRLPDGENLVQLIVTDNSGKSASDTVLVTVSAGPSITTLADLPGLTLNQKQTALALDRICTQLRDQSAAGPQLSADQQDLLARCNGLQIDNTTANQVAALDELTADGFSVARTQTLLFASTQYAGVMDRLLALRGGAKGLSLAGLNIVVDGKLVPLAQLQEIAKGLFGGGASADEPDGLLSDKWGL